MKYNLIQLKKGAFELDFVKNENGDQFTSATNFANKCGMDVKYVNRIINKDKILSHVSQKIGMRDAKNRHQKMVLINSDYFLYFLTTIKGLKGANIAPDFISNLIIMFPMFLREMQRRANFLYECMEENRSDQIRVNKIERLEAFCRKEKSRLINQIKQRNIEEFVYETFSDGSVQPQLELEDRFYRTTIEIEAEIIE